MVLYWDCTRIAQGWAFDNSARSLIECNHRMSHPHDARGPSGRPSPRCAQQSRALGMAARPPPTQQTAELGPGPPPTLGSGKSTARVCGARMARTESIPNLITSACYEPMTLCIYKDLFNLLSRDSYTNYAYSMQNMQ